LLSPLLLAQAHRTFTVPFDLVVIAYAVVDDYRYLELSQWRWGLSSGGRAYRHEGKEIIFMHQVVDIEISPDSGPQTSEESLAAINRARERKGIPVSELVRRAE
jgi:hypothetical protein